MHCASEAELEADGGGQEGLRAALQGCSNRTGESRDTLLLGSPRAAAPQS